MVVIKARREKGIRRKEEGLTKGVGRRSDNAGSKNALETIGSGKKRERRENK